MTEQFLLATTPVASHRMTLNDDGTIELEQETHFKMDAYAIHTLKWFLGEVINSPDVRHTYHQNDWPWHLEYDPSEYGFKQFGIRHVGSNRTILMSGADMRKLYSALMGNTERLVKKEE